MKLDNNKIRRLIKNLILALTIYAIFFITPYKPYMLIGLSTVLVLTVILRTVFCGWLCPLGTVLDIIWRIGQRLKKISFIKKINSPYKKWVKLNRNKLDKIDHYAKYFKYAFLLWIIQSAIFGIATIKNEGERGIESVLYMLIAFLVLGLFIERSWCRYACPVGAVIGLFGKLSSTHIQRESDACINCRICSNVCPMNIDVANIDSVLDADCHTCVKCVDACPVDEALDLKIKIPLMKSRQ